MLVLPRMTAPAVAQALGDVRVVRRDVALEDPRPGRALAAADRDEVLEPDRDAEQRVERVERGRRPRRGRRRAARRRSSASASARVAVDGQPGVERAVVALGGVEMRRPSRRATRRSPARSRAASSWARQAAVGIGRSSGASVAAEDRRDDDEVALALGGVGEDVLDRQRRVDDVVAQDVLELDGLGRRGDVVGRDRRPGSRTGRGCG